jgi:aspartate racemase
MYTVDFAEIEILQQQGRWEEAGIALATVAQQLERGGADLLVLCTNTMHLVAEAISTAVSIPLLHIADPTAEAIRAQGLNTIGLLGTRFTMEQEFYRGRLVAQHGLNVLIPEPQERAEIHRVIYEELVLGEIRPASRQKYLAIIEHMAQAGAEGVILGCTEIGLLVKLGDTSVPLFDTTALHARAAVHAALAGDERL